MNKILKGDVINIIYEKFNIDIKSVVKNVKNKNGTTILKLKIIK